MCDLTIHCSSVPSDILLLILASGPHLAASCWKWAVLDWVTSRTFSTHWRRNIWEHASSCLSQENILHVCSHNCFSSSWTFEPHHPGSNVTAPLFLLGDPQINKKATKKSLNKFWNKTAVVERHSSHTLFSLWILKSVVSVFLLADEVKMLESLRHDLGDTYSSW